MVETPSGFHLQSKALGAGHELAWHRHPRPTVCVVYGGEVEEEDARNLRRRTRGDLVLRPETERHRNRVVSESARILCIEIEPSTMEALVRESALPARGTRYHRSTRAEFLARQIHGELAVLGPSSCLRLQALTLDLLALVVEREEAPSSPAPWLRRLHDQLREDFRDNRTLDELAAVYGHPAHRISREFRRHYGRSVPEFVRSLRLAHAVRLLTETAMPLAEVALESGFYDQSHLTRRLKEATGKTPAEFRERV